MSRRDLGGDALRALAAVAIVTVATATGRLLDVDLTAAALLLLVAAVLATLLGSVSAIVGTVGGFLALNYFFAAPRDGLENALKFAPLGSEILVSASLTTDARDVVVRVTDHGPGIPEDERVRIFEEFSRVDARPDGTGTGLGLAIVQALVTAHGGHVWCEATPAGGATFAFDLPALP